MDEKEKDYVAKNDGELDDLAVDNESASTEPIEETKEQTQNKEWEFDACAHTLDDNLSLDDEFSVEVANNSNDDTVQEQPADNQNNNVNVSSNSADSNIPKFILASVLTVLVAVLIAFMGVRYYTVPNAEEKMNPGNVAVTVGDTPVSIGMYNYCYNGTVNRILRSHGSELKSDVPFSQQTILDSEGNEVNVEEYFKSETLAYLQGMMSCYESGVKSGVKLSAQQKAEIDKEVAAVKNAAQKSELGINEFTQKNFGEYCGLATYQKYLEQQIIANEYKNRFFVENTYTKDEKEKFFNDNVSKFQEIPLAFLLVPFDAQEEGSKEKVIADAQSYCQNITDVASIKKLVPVIYKDLIDKNIELGHYQTAEEAIAELEKMVETKINMQSLDFNDEVKEWLFDSETPVNACNYFVDDYFNCVFIVLKTGEPAVNEGYNENVYAVRHILVKPKHAQDSTNANSQEFTEEEWEAAKNEAQTIYDTYMNGEKNELSFALLAEEHSEDVESTSNGRSGLYGGIIDNCRLGSTVQDFENWAIDPSRQYADTGIVKSEFGYHIMFFKSYEPLYLAVSNNEMIYEKAEDEIKSHELVEHKSAMEKTKVAKVSDYQ